MFALIDCNNFYASCERSFKPDLNGKPVVVLSNNDGCVIARSNEAKKLGIPMGAPAFEYQNIFDQNQVNVFSSNYALYGDISDRVMRILSEYSPDSEIYSIDECFLQFEGFDNFDLKEHGIKMKEQVWKQTLIPVSVGVAPTKALAKVANKVAKKFQAETQGVYVMQTREQIRKALTWTKIEDVWGIGRQHANRLKSLGIKNALQFTELPEYWAQKNMSIVGLRLHRELRGIPQLELEDVANKKNIACTRSFDKMLRNVEDIEERVTTYAVKCAEKLRRQNSYCNVVTVFVRTNPFREDRPQYGNSVTIKLPYPTNSNITLAKFAKQGLQKIFIEGFDYKKAGVIVGGFNQAPERQLNLFENEPENHEPLMQSIDKLNKIFGVHKVKLASQDLGRVWKMRQEKLSPCYTTRWEDILKIK